jgi:DNA-binding response OmpR family regulator
MRVLLIEDDRSIAQSIELMLKAENSALCSCHHRRPLLAAAATFYALSSSVIYQESRHGRAGYRKLTRQTI